jgi:toxin ParE1/3/4
MGRVHKHAAAKRDLVEHFVYLSENAGLDVADHFLLQADESFSDVASHPALGVELALLKAEVAGMRKWHVKGFEKFLSFYRPGKDGISIVRVSHAAQD